MTLSEHEYCVAITFKMTEWVEQWICIKFYVKLEHSSVESIQIIQKAAAMGNRWLPASTQLCIHHASRLVWSCFLIFVLVECQITQVTQPPYSPDLAPCDFWLFPKLKSPLKGKRFQTVDEIRKIQWDSWWWLAELCKFPRCLLWRGLRYHCPVYNVSCIFFNKCLYFSYCWTGYLLDRPYISTPCPLSM